MSGADPIPVLHIFGETIRILVTGRQSGGAFAMFDETTPVGGGPPLHRHANEDEWFSVLEGRALFEVDGRRTEAGPGEFAFAPRGTAHTFRSIGDVPLRMHIVVAPPRLDQFFFDVAKVWTSEPPPERVLSSLFAKHGLELLGPPLTA